MSEFRRRLIIQNKDEKWDYELYNQEFDGTNFIDTNITLFESIGKKWQLEVVLKSKDVSFDTNDTIIACQLTTASPYPGFVVAYKKNGDVSSTNEAGFYFEIAYKVSYYLGKFLDDTKLIITYDNNGFTVNGKLFNYPVNTIIDRHLFLGANQSYGNNYYRFWHGYIYSFKFRWL